MYNDYKHINLMKKNLTLFFLLVQMATSVAWAGEVHFPRNGELGNYDDPFRIQTVEDMNLLAQDVNSGTPYSGMYFSLEASLYYGNQPKDQTGSNYTPIGTLENPFEGNFYGNGYYINGIVINRTGTTEQDMYNGVFGCMFGYVNRLVLENSKITGHKYTGGIVGFGGYNIHDCHVGSNVTINVTEGYYDMARCFAA